LAKIGIIRGKVWKFGDNISTTDITPGEMFMGQRKEPKEIAFAAIRPEWRDQVKPGDCIVAGKNFGFGSHRASANDVMKDLGLGCIVADSIARIYYRSGIAIGFPAFACPGVSEIFEEGDEIELDIYTGTVKNLTTGKSLKGNPYPSQLLEILDSGGIMPRLVEQAKQEE
jgi:3-isopropylmalate/(R)-2-methylmalate dehydratase small subunit